MTFICKCGREFRWWGALVAHLTDHNIAYPRRHGYARVTQESLEAFLSRQDQQGHSR